MKYNKEYGGTYGYRKWEFENFISKDSIYIHKPGLFTA